MAGYALWFVKVTTPTNPFIFSLAENCTQLPCDQKIMEMADGHFQLFAIYTLPFPNTVSVVGVSCYFNTIYFNTYFLFGLKQLILNDYYTFEGKGSETLKPYRNEVC